MKLMNDVDKDIITNKKIINQIKNIKSTSDTISFGQAQKVINVCLKQYCFIQGKEHLLGQLDCPLDKTTMKGYKINNKLYTVKENDYRSYQRKYQNEDEWKITKDNKYDDNRINNCINLGN